jgi:hypothetical protein
MYFQAHTLHTRLKYPVRTPSFGVECKEAVFFGNFEHFLPSYLPLGERFS